MKKNALNRMQFLSGSGTYLHLKIYPIRFQQLYFFSEAVIPKQIEN